MTYPILRLKKGREKSLLRHNYWIFSGAVETPPNAESGDIVDIVSYQGAFLARGSWSAESQISAKVWSFKMDTEIDEPFFRSAIRSAIQLRAAIGITSFSTGYRLIAAEGDALPGIITDIYENYAVVQFLSAGAEKMRGIFISALAEELPLLKGIYERSDVSVRKKEGLGERTGVIQGEIPPEFITFKEHSLTLVADIAGGHKTGFYFDQRENRRLAGEYAAGRKVLNLFSYTGGFGASCGKNGAEFVENVDSSRPALALAQKNMELNNIAADRYLNTEANVFELLRSYADGGRKFDMIILDPPKLVESQGGLMRGCRAYKELALRAFKLLNRNGLLFTFSCSGLVEASLFAKITFDAAQDAVCEGAIVRRLTQDADHPVRLNHPETSYLKGLLVVKTNA